MNILVLELNELLRYRLIETDDSISDKEFDANLDTHQNITISAKGSFYINNFINSFKYIDLVLQDTPIYDTASYDQIRKSFPLSNDQGKQNLLARIQTVELFIEYLQKEEKRELIESEDIPKGIVNSMLTDGLENDLLILKRIQKRLEHQ